MRSARARLAVGSRVASMPCPTHTHDLAAHTLALSLNIHRSPSPSPSLRVPRITFLDRMNVESLPTYTVLATDAPPHAEAATEAAPSPLATVPTSL